jgi:hypothetical protein
MSTADPNHVMMTGENPFIRLSETDGGEHSTDASYWRVMFSPAGPGHVLFMRSELTGDELRIYSDNIAMTRWLQSTIQGVLNPATADLALPVVDAEFSKSGDPNYFWTEHISSLQDEITMTWYDVAESLLIHTEPNAAPDRPYGVCTILMPAAGARLTVNGESAKGRPWTRERERRPFSTCCLAFSESWTETR